MSRAKRSYRVNINRLKQVIYTAQTMHKAFAGRANNEQVEQAIEQYCCELFHLFDLGAVLVDAAGPAAQGNDGLGYYRICISQVVEIGYSDNDELTRRLDALEERLTGYDFTPNENSLYAKLCELREQVPGDSGMALA